MMLDTYQEKPATPSEQAPAGREQLLIHGARRPAQSGRYFETVDPATETVIARVAEGDAADVDAAVVSARAAFDGEWGHLKASERGRLLLRWAELIRDHENALVELESLDSGKPVSTIRRQDLPAVLDTLTYYAGWADKINGQVIPARTDALTYSLREPIGVVGAIVPWNFPLMIGMWKIAPALACGCTVVLKPAELTSLTALKLGELALAAGIPPGVLNVVSGFGKTAGAALVEHPGVDKVTFTGSPAVGRQILRAASGNLKRVTLELGGKSHLLQFGAGVFRRLPHPGARIDSRRGRRSPRGARRCHPHGRSPRPGDRHGAVGVGGPDASRARIHRHRQARGRGARCRRRARRRHRILRRADRVRQRRAFDAHLAGRNFWAGGCGDPFQG
jgi:aldehyde dehydrogenase (NAD+)